MARRQLLNLKQLAERRQSQGTVPSTIRRMEPGGEALENQWRSAAVCQYRAADPSHLVKDLPLYTL
jgi:hypothetical protein